MALPSVVQFYRSVIDDVVNNIRETFLDDGVDEQVLLELKQVWENKLTQSKAVPSENAPSAAEAPVTRETASHHNARSSNTTVATTATSTPTTTTSTTTSSSSFASTPAAAAAAATIVQPTLQYHYTTAGQDGANEASKSVTFTLPQTVAGSQKPVTITLPPHMMQTGLMMSSSASAAAQALPTNVAAGLLSQPSDGGSGVTYQTLTPDQLAKQGYVLSMTHGSTSTTTTASASSSSTSAQLRPAGSGIIQLDGANDTSDDDDDDDEFKDDDNDADDDEQNEEDNEGIGEEEEPLNSEDDVSDEDPSELFDTDNVIVCQYDKITRSRNKWKFHLKDGIMNLQGRDFIFQKALGDAEW